MYEEHLVGLNVPALVLVVAGLVLEVATVVRAVREVDSGAVEAGVGEAVVEAVVARVDLLRLCVVRTVE